MADPVDPVPPGTAEEITKVGEASQKAADDIANMSNMVISSRASFTGMGTAMNGVSNMFSQLSSSMRGFGISLNEIKSLTSQQREQFTLVSAAVIGARESFTGLANVDTTGLSTFSGQLGELMTTLKNEGPITSKVAEGLADLAKKAGASDSAIAQAGAKGVAGLTALAQSMITAADNGLRLQNAVIQMAGSTGGLKEVFDLAGGGLENMNALLAKHQQVISDAGAATGVHTAQIEKYYAQLGSVPKALSSLVKGSGDADTRVNMLAATMKVATGTGRNYTEVVDDMKTAFKNYGVVGEDALKFSAQMSEVSNNLGVEMDTVRKALIGTADTFKMFAGTQKEASRMSSEFAQVMNTYAGALERTGLSGTQAVEVVKGMTGQLSQLSIAQKAFLSAQTGGPGGLMGSFQIDKMMREGKISEVFEKVRKQMSQQFGKIVTLDEASQSQGAAAQMTKQMMILRQGPLGQFAKTDVEAQRILEGFKEMEKGGPGAAQKLSDNVVQESMDKGTAIQEKSYTVLTEINQGIAALRGNANIGALGMMQKSFAAGSGTGEFGAENNVATRLRGTMAGATNMRADKIRDSLSTDTANKKLVDTSGRSAAAAISSFEKTLSPDAMKDAIKQPLEVLKKAFSATGTDYGEEGIQKAKDDLKAKIEKLKSDAQSMPTNQRGGAMTDIAKGEDALKKIDAYQAAIAAGKPASDRNVRPPGAQVGAAAGRAAAAKPATPGGGPQPGTVGAASPPGGKHDIMVHVTGYCLKCKQTIEGGEQSETVNTASGKI